MIIDSVLFRSKHANQWRKKIVLYSHAVVSLENRSGLAYHINKIRSNKLYNTYSDQIYESAQTISSIRWQYI